MKAFSKTTVSQVSQPESSGPICLGSHAMPRADYFPVSGYFDKHNALFHAGVFNEATEVLVSGSGTPAELASLRVLDQQYHLGLNLWGVESREDHLQSVRRSLDSFALKSGIRLLHGEANELPVIMSENALLSWDIIFDQGDGPLSFCLSEGRVDQAIELIHTYAGCLKKGGKLVLENNLHQLEPPRQIMSFLASDKSDFESLVEVTAPLLLDLDIPGMAKDYVNWVYTKSCDQLKK